MSRVLRTLGWLLFVLGYVVGPAFAQVTGPPHVFVANTVASPDEVNLNFSTVYAAALNRSGGTMTGNLLFSADNTLDIGASGATRPRDLFLGRNAAIGGTLGVTGAATFTSTAAINSTSASALDVAGGIQAGSGNVSIIGTDGRIPAISSTYFASLSGVNLTFATLNIENSTATRLFMRDTSAAADNERWDLATNGTIFTLEAVNDAGNVFTTAWTVTRSGSSITNMSVAAPLSVIGTIDASSAIRGQSNGSFASGTGAELGWTGTTAFLQGFNRTGGVYVPLNLFGSTVGVNIGAGTITSWGTDGTMTHASALVLSRSRSITTADGEQTITLNADDYELRLAPGGTASDDQIVGFTGGTAGRRIVVCDVGAPAGANGLLQYTINDGAITASNRITRYDGSEAEGPITLGAVCLPFHYDGTSSRWRAGG